MRVDLLEEIGVSMGLELASPAPPCGATPTQDAESGGFTSSPGANPQRGRLRRSGRMLPLVRPGTIAPPVQPVEDAADDYDEVSIEPSLPDSDDEPDEKDETDPRQKQP